MFEHYDQNDPECLTRHYSSPHAFVERSIHMMPSVTEPVRAWATHSGIPLVLRVYCYPDIATMEQDTKNPGGNTWANATSILEMNADGEFSIVTP